MRSERGCSDPGRPIRRRWRAARALRALVGIGILFVVARGVVHAAAAPLPARVVVVQPGESLWSLGRRYAPHGTDLRRWVFDVEQLNGLRHAGVMAGEEVRVPR